METATKPDISIAPAIPEIERAMNLPDLIGTERQVAFARIIRFRFLTEIYDSIIDVMDAMDAIEYAATEKKLTVLKRTRSCFKWIEKKKEIGSAISFFMADIPDINDGERAAAAYRRKKLMKEIVKASVAHEWEVSNGIPAICGKKSLRSMGARCRYYLRKDEPDRARKEKRNAKHWIELVENSGFFVERQADSLFA